MRNLKFICAQPDDTYYTWQVHLWLESLKNIGHSDKAIVLIFIPNFREKNEKWQQVIDLYPEAEFVFYKDVDGVTGLDVLEEWKVCNCGPLLAGWKIEHKKKEITRPSSTIDHEYILKEQRRC
jgi:hypothetical protein